MNKVSGTRRPTAHQQRWHDWLREQGCYLGLGPAAIHHCVGSTALHEIDPDSDIYDYRFDDNVPDWFDAWDYFMISTHIGQDFVIPLSWEAHQGPCGIQGDLSIFAGHGLGDTRKEIEKTIFRRMVETYKRQHDGALPMDADVYVAILGYHK